MKFANPLVVVKDAPVSTLHRGVLPVLPPEQQRPDQHAERELYAYPKEVDEGTDLLREYRSKYGKAAQPITPTPINAMPRRLRPM
jgi:hypothetical protein